MKRHAYKPVERLSPLPIHFALKEAKKELGYTVSDYTHHLEGGLLKLRVSS